MHKTEKITAMIPAKLGSTRLAMKNLALVGGKPLIYYPIAYAKASGAFDRIVINAEDALFSAIAKRYRVDFYLRPREIVGPATKTDTVVYDFLRSNPCDIVAWISPIAPLQSAEEIRRMVGFFLKNKLDSLMTVKDEQVHCVYRGRPVNFKEDEIFAQTQDLVAVQAFVYTVMIWRAEVFMRAFEEKGSAVLSGRVGYFPVGKPSAVIIKRQEDLMMAESLHRALHTKAGYRVRYDGIMKKAAKKGMR